jgi:hypothetical protein
MSIERRTTKRAVVYDVRLCGLHGRAIKRTFSTKRSAQDFEASQRLDQRRGTWIDPAGGKTPLEQWAWMCLDSDVAKSPGTRATDAGILRSAILPVLGRRPLGGSPRSRSNSSWRRGRRSSSPEPSGGDTPSSQRCFRLP